MKHKKHKRKHKTKLAGLFATKILFALLTFILGMYVGTLIENPFLALLIGGTVAIITYFLLIVNAVEWFHLR